MFEASLITLLATDTEITDRLAAFSGAPAIFSGMAPQAAILPYIVLDIDKNAVENLAVSAFTVSLNIYIRQESGKEMREIAERIEFVCDRAVMDNDSRFGQIRLFFEDGRESENSDIKIKHYVIRLGARAGRKKWAAYRATL